jgi:hypothetical protein
LVHKDLKVHPLKVHRVQEVIQEPPTQVQQVQVGQLILVLKDLVVTKDRQETMEQKVTKVLREPKDTKVIRVIKV